jgi:hypothetical protein
VRAQSEDRERERVGKRRRSATQTEEESERERERGEDKRKLRSFSLSDNTALWKIFDLLYRLARDLQFPVAAIPFLGNYGGFPVMSDKNNLLGVANLVKARGSRDG